MIKNSGMTCENYSHTLQGWANNPNSASFVTFGDQTGMEYSSEVTDAIDYLINDLNWDVSGLVEGSCSLTVTDLTFTKEVDLSTAELGNVLTYTFTVENTGDVDLFEVEIIDNDLTGLSAINYTWPNADGELAAGEIMTATATYTVTQDDVDNGSVENLATLKAKDENGDPLDETESTDDLNNPGKPGIAGSPTITVISAAPTADLTFTKEVDLSTAELGDILTYTFTVENTGDVNLFEVEIIDNDLTGLSAINYTWPNADGELAAGEIMTATATYTVTQDDVDNGSVENLATLKAKDENGDPLDETESTDDLNNPGKPGIAGSPTITIITTPPVVATPFVTIWNTGNPGASGNGQIIIPAQGQYNYTWENLDNPAQQGSGSANGTIVLSLPALGEFKLSITPTGPNPFHQIRFNDSGDKMKIISVESWGTTKWSSLEKAFYGAKNLTISATDVPDLSQVNNMSFAFASTGISTVSGMDNWDVSQVNNMTSIFEKAADFNENINSWDVSNVTVLNKAFKQAESFNQPLNNWDVSQVISIESMFERAISFDQNINNWNLESLNSMTSLFKDATSFNQPLNNWDISQINDLSDVFNGAQNFNQDLSSWNVENVTKMTRVFAHTNAFNQSLNSWNVNNVTNMNNMFQSAIAFNQDLSNWNVSNVNRMKSMFDGAENFDQDLSGWNVSSVKDMDAMFKDALSFDQQLSTWNLNNLETAKNMFDYSGMDCLNYSHTLKNWAENPNTPTNVTLGAAMKEYSTQVEEHRNNLLMNLGWNIIGDSLGTCLLNVESKTPIVFEVYPNPTRDLLFIRGLQGSESIELFDFNGRLVYNSSNVKKEESIDLSSFASGVYYLTIKSENQIKTTHKIIKTN